ncbi:hypothetical protein [Ferrimonas marina]|uniref:Uncharacterized protein n=1 Tax=Ferrimonas marina TaxID=299255 RepID=A0A1M5ZLY7_9GAMM|nr:hypothetical protein [Ferrimonas marina]SHI24943.1 hypothetical protein SAMN02745129_0397 [Ferrimonas marina]
MISVFALAAAALLQGAVMAAEPEDEVGALVDPPTSVGDDLVLLTRPAQWRGERILLPPEFAPQMAQRGIEELRFAPGMYEPEAEDFFSYLFVFQFERREPLTADELEAMLLAYYLGLCQTVAEDNAFACPAESVTLTLDPVLGGYLARLDWVEPFVTGQPQRLYLELTPVSGDSGALLYGAVSPQPLDHALWSTLRRGIPLSKPQQ